ncbi:MULTISPECIES: phytanoyl-CoA dioxygenase family protein [Streptomyces]|uniref:Phytanoyl-CoA dioxygenase family protein n=1 Tax=Streptomyces evansiae TaxID=3075535 RepID=A0ABD5ECI3_9ACTN|nr:MULTISPECIES: phytanoyl-CoA dioxygenase family protein [unclassified Streptomyces]ASY33107.1 phytanoyl-CoA dioxygenase [Streptomyces sp. CLI2509]MDT0418492.1 phytanoyl-CoA dioxygenase family protein [Streptomyces sp. DSM 41982]MYX23246.1 phytanoyl-CoA dioxygenase family protein [Streptomyces sp. SID8380]SCE03166.1 Phytanoyl-CoA dioxygenase (PhyH) [Streptomyces sp. SolWspMP-sol7th]
MPVDTDRTLAEKFEADGFVTTGRLLSEAEVDTYREIYDRFLSGEIESGDKRSDLGSHVTRKNGVKENITQIMWPSALHKTLMDMPLHARALSMAKELIGEDAVFDFDMLIHKAPHADVATPWHQDAAYWIDLPDKRAVSIWVALDDAVPDNGCMWYVKGSHKQPLRRHYETADGKNIQCDCSEDEPGATAIPLGLGEGVAHSGTTLHYSRGNSTHSVRRAYILNFRPAEMLRLERERGYDVGLTENVRLVRNSDAAQDAGIQK